LDHLDQLGVNTVYLTPIFPARSNHRYDAATFDRVDPLLGGDAALVRLADAVRARGWRLLGDITSNHTGDELRRLHRPGLVLAAPRRPAGANFLGTPGGVPRRDAEAVLATMAAYRSLIALRRAEPALRHGGLRWLHHDPDTLVFLREAPAGSVLVLARRAPGTPVRLTGLPAADNVYGGACALRPGPDGVSTLPGDGPTFQAWRLW
jgi:glycosidase